MKKEGFILLSFILFLALFAISASAVNCGGNVVCNCGNNLNESRVLNASDNLTGCTGNGLNISTNGVVLDCNGTQINGSLLGDGIDNTGFSNVIIKNCYIAGFDIGLYSNGNLNNTFLNLSVTNNLEYGLLFLLSNNNTLNNIISNDNSGVGTVFAMSRNNNISNLTVSGNYIGVWVTSSFDEDDRNHFYDINANSNDLYGIELEDTTINYFERVILTNNTYNGIWAKGAHYNVFNNITSSGNGIGGIYFGTTDSCILSNMSLSDGISIYSSSELGVSENNTLINNNFSGFSVSGNNTVYTNNYINGKIIYYNYSISNYTYDGNTAPNAGLVYCENCNNITVRNLNLSSGGGSGLGIPDTTNSLFENLTINGNAYGISASPTGMLGIETNNTFSNLTIRHNYYYGIYLGSAIKNNLTNIILDDNYFGMNIISDGLLNNGNCDNILNNISLSNSLYCGIEIDGKNNSIFNSSFSKNTFDLCGSSLSNNTYINNQFIDSSNSRMINLINISRTRILNETVYFNISMFYLNGTSCPSCRYNLETSPSETIYNLTNGNNIIGNFTVTRFGLYSLIVNVTDSNNNTAKTKYSFFINESTSTIRYYFRNTNPINSKANDVNVKSLKTSQPTSEEIISDLGRGLIKFNLDDIPQNQTIFAIDSIRLYFLYNASDNPKVGIQRYSDDNITLFDYQQNLGNTTDYNFTNVNFTNLNWTMDYLRNPFSVAVKLTGTGQSLKTNSTNLSYADITYRYIINPEIKSISNTKINLLSATTSATDTTNATIILEGEGNTSLVVGMSDTSSNYIVKRDGVACSETNANCNFTQSNGEINFSNIALGSQHTITIEKIIQAVEEAVGGAARQIGVGTGTKINKTIEEKPQPKKIGLFTRWNINQIIQQNYMFFVFIGLFILIILFLTIRGIKNKNKYRNKIRIKSFYAK
jgi:hypothetical protein